MSSHDPEGSIPTRRRAGSEVTQLETERERVPAENRGNHGIAALEPAATAGVRPPGVGPPRPRRYEPPAVVWSEPIDQAVMLAAACGKTYQSPDAQCAPAPGS